MPPSCRLRMQASREDNIFTARVFEIWDQWTSPADGFSRQRLSHQEVEELRRLLHRGPCVFPTTKGGWASLQVRGPCTPLHFLQRC